MTDKDIESAIAKASSSKSDEDYLSFFELAKGEEFYFNYRESDGQMTVPLIAVGRSSRAVVFHSTKQSVGVHGKYAGIVWEKGLEMVARMQGADGLVIQNSNETWIAISRVKIMELLAQASHR